MLLDKNELAQHVTACKLSANADSFCPGLWEALQILSDQVLVHLAPLEFGMPPCSGGLQNQLAPADMGRLMVIS